MESELLQKAAALLQQSTVLGSPEGDVPYCSLALIDAGGYPTVSTITASKAEDIRQITFCTGLESNKARRIRSCNRASVCFNTGGQYNITLVGTMEIVTDAAVKREMWYEGLGNHFSGPEDPGYCVLRFHTQRYSLLVDWKDAEGTL